MNGKQFAVTLRDEKGDIITSQRKAELAAAQILHPIIAKSKNEQLHQILEAVETADAKFFRLQEEQKEAENKAEEERIDAESVFENGWEIFMSCSKRPASCKRYTMENMPQHCTMKNYNAYYRKFIAWLKQHDPNKKRLSEITEDEAAVFMNHIQSYGASGTYNKYLQFFNMFFDVLNEAGKLKCGNPFKEIDRMEHRYHSKKPLSLEQIANLIQSADGEMRILIALGYFTGLRFGDCCTLLWQEVDLLRGVIERVPRKTEHTVKDVQQALVKVGIPQYLRQLLASIPESKRKGYILPHFAKEYLEGKEYRANRRLLDYFESCGIHTIKPGTGTPEVRNEAGKLIKPAIRAVVECGFHSLRYSYISHNAEAGTPAAIIQRNAGHANPAMTEHYTKISDKAALHYANVLSLPFQEEDRVIEVPVCDSFETERIELIELVKSLPIEDVRKLLQQLKGK